MGDPRQAMAAIANMNGFLGFDPMGRPLVVRLADNRDRSSSGRAAFGREPQGGYHAVPPQQPVYGGYGQPGYPVSGYAPQQTYMADQYQYGQYYEQPPPLPEEELPPPPPMPEEEPPPLPEEEPPPPPPPEEGVQMKVTFKVSTKSSWQKWEEINCIIVVLNMFYPSCKNLNHAAVRFRHNTI
eukprot:jgi/Picre1/36037/NNA_003494.t2